MVANDRQTLLARLSEMEDGVCTQTARNGKRVAECKLCRKIEAPNSNAFYCRDVSHPLPDEVLAITPKFPSSGGRMHRTFRCRKCKMLYGYDTDYEYLANGSEDEEMVTRLCIGEQIAVYRTMVVNKTGGLQFGSTRSAFWRLEKAVKEADLD